jgi:hypothetical protein
MHIPQLTSHITTECRYQVNSSVLYLNLILLSLLLTVFSEKLVSLPSIFDNSPFIVAYPLHPSVSVKFQYIRAYNVNKWQQSFITIRRPIKVPIFELLETKQPTYQSLGFRFTNIDSHSLACLFLPYINLYLKKTVITSSFFTKKILCFMTLYQLLLEKCFHLQHQCCQ